MYCTFVVVLIVDFCHLVSQVPHLLHISLKLCYPVYKLCLSLYSTSLKLLVNLFITTSMNSIHTYLGNPCRVRKLSCQRLWYKTIEWRSSVTEAKNPGILIVSYYVIVFNLYIFINKVSNLSDYMFCLLFYIIDSWVQFYCLIPAHLR